MEEKMKWTVGLITAPRKEGYYLDKTLDSLARTGFSDVRIFAEPGSIVPEGYNATYRKKQYGDWTNWATAFYELLLSEPDTDLFLMIEDDIILCRMTKEYLEYSIPQLGEFASVSPYTPSKLKRRNIVGFHNESRGIQTWSTQAVVMTRQKAICFFSDYDVQRHRFENVFGKDEKYWCLPYTDSKNSIKDVVIGHWAAKNNLPIYYHTPSLVEHIGYHSTLTDMKTTVENSRKSADFVGENYDLSEWMKSPIKVAKLTSVPLF